MDGAITLVDAEHLITRTLLWLKCVFGYYLLLTMDLHGTNVEFYIFSFQLTKMQDEVTKHTRKIYHTMKSPGHSFWEKTKEIVIEIFIIVFAVTLSIWFHNWSDHRREQKETEEFLKGLKEDLAKDIKLLEENKKTFAHVNANFNFISALNDNKTIDTASEKTISQHMGFELCSTHPNTARYEGFKSSGKIGTIENDSLKQNILVYYQQNMTDVEDHETFVNSLQTKMLDVVVDRDYKITEKDLAKSLKIRALLQLSEENLNSSIEAYDSAGQQAKKIISMINREPGHRSM